jgi:hypothetical protein
MSPSMVAVLLLLLTLYFEHFLERSFSLIAIFCEHAPAQ